MDESNLSIGRVDGVDARVLQDQNVLPEHCQMCLFVRIVHVSFQERDELLRRLREGDDKLAKERARQAELARLKREQRKARQEEKFDAAAIVLGMAQKGEKV